MENSPHKGFLLNYLAEAAASGLNYHIIRLMRSGQNVNSTDMYGYSAIVNAASGMHIHAIDILLGSFST